MPENPDNLYNPGVFETVGCTLHAYGTNFRPEALLSELSFSGAEVLAAGVLGLPDKTRERIDEGKLDYRVVADRTRRRDFQDQAEPLSVRPLSDDIGKEAVRAFDTPFLLIRVSKAPQLSVQIAEARLFLEHHMDELKKLRLYPNVESILIRFSVEAQQSHFEDLPTDFTTLAAEIGIEGILL